VEVVGTVVVVRPGVVVVDDPVGTVVVVVVLVVDVVDVVTPDGVPEVPVVVVETGARTTVVEGEVVTGVVVGVTGTTDWVTVTVATGGGRTRI
jgi:hypothetical protein